jgi:predicted PolB exonuclease-like 3'-5' exonuclease
MNVLVFDIETVPDVELGRRALGLAGLADAEVAKAMFARCRQDSGRDFLSHELQRVITISCMWRSREELRLFSLAEPDCSEAQILERFFAGIERHVPTLVSWNGAGFDLPVLHYRALRHGVQAARYWDTGDVDREFRFNNYLGRFHWRHVDLMDVLSGFQSRARASLTDVALLLGLPGKLGFSGDRVWETWLAGDLAGIRRYCETDVLNTYLVFLRFELMRGHLSREDHAAEIERLREYLRASREPHCAEFLSAWEAPA